MNHDVRSSFTVFFIFIAIALTTAYFLCHINPDIESGWLRGLWHGINLGPNFMLSFFDGRLLKAPMHSLAYSFFWWVFSIWSCLFWCNMIWQTIGKVFGRKTIKPQEKSQIEPPEKKQIKTQVKQTTDSQVYNQIKPPVKKPMEPPLKKTIDFQANNTVQKEATKIVRRARGTEIPKRAQRVFFCCDARNANDKESLIADLLSHDAGMDCVVSWIEKPDGKIDKDLLRNELQDTQALVLWVTKDLLQSMYENKFPDEYLIAQELRTPILPIATFGDLFPEFTRLAGAIHGIAQSDSEYRTKLKEQMETFLASEEVIKQIQEKAFTAEIFLSYRKMDIAEARKFMKTFHDLEKFEAVSIWYDNFLTAGRNFDFEIKESITNSDVFVLLVTPNLATEGNYVQTTEYPFAQQEGKPVVPVETIPADPVIFANLFPGTEKPVPLYEPVELTTAFHDKLDKSAYQWQMDSERAYLLGMAYFKGFGVERDIDRAVRLMEIASKDCNQSALNAIYQLGKIYTDGIGIDINYDKSLYWNKKYADYSEQLMGLFHLNTAVAYNNMAVVYGNRSDCSKALEYFGKSLFIYEKVYGPTHPNTVTTYNNIATEYDRQGNYNKALEYFKKTMEIREEILGTEHPDTATTYNHIVMVFRNQGNYDMALEYCRKALSIFEKTLGTEHPNTATTYNHMAWIFDKLGDHTKALEYFKKALFIREKVLSTEHLETATTYSDMAVVYNNIVNFDQALEYNEKALSIREKVLGTTHPDTATIYSNMASVFSKQGDYDKALEFYIKALPIYEKAYGTDHSWTATTNNNIALVYYRKGEYAKSLEYNEKALLILEKVLGNTHLDTATTYENVAMVFYNQGNYGKALEYYGKAIPVYEKVFGTAHTNTATIYNNIANVYLNQGDYGKALEWFFKSMLICLHVFGLEHPTSKTIFNNMAYTYEKSGNPEPFKEWLRKHVKS